MAGEALTEPLLPRGRDDRSTGPAYSVVSIAPPTTATAPAHRRATNDAAPATANSPAFAVDHDAALDNTSASPITALASASSPTPPWEDRADNLPPVVAVHRKDAALFAVDHAAAHENSSAPTTSTLASASPAKTCGLDRRASLVPDAALKGASASHPATPSPGRRADLPASVVPKGLPTSPTTPAPPAVAAMSGSEAVVRIAPIEDGSPSPRRVRNSPGMPRSTEKEVIAESVGGGSDDGSANIRRSTSTASTRDRSSSRTPRGRRLYRRVGLRRTPMPVPQKDTWDKESFMYTCVLVLLVGLVAYLSTMLDGWSPYLRVIFIGIFGAATGLACIGAMALISETPDPSARHFAHIVSRVTFIVGSLAFKAAVFYLLGEAGFIVWLVVAAGTVLWMTYIWKAGNLESFTALVSCPGSAYRRVMGLFRRA